MCLVVCSDSFLDDPVDTAAFARSVAAGREKGLAALRGAVSSDCRWIFAFAQGQTYLKRRSQHQQRSVKSFVFFATFGSIIGVRSHSSSSLVLVLETTIAKKAWRIGYGWP
jgi:hypothetical protein